ncbi:MAG: isoprenoid biosynthesis glyoxalase ElbB [Elusimicrobia bacterium]|nr:isoprenoid biosynthesis glyoxalase ElbB [Elusimicrobiota bacterium]
MKIGIVLSGCGVKDGTEIHESVLTLLAVGRIPAEPVFMAPDIDQLDVVNHLTDKTPAEKRNVLAESGRIARGSIKDIKEVKEKELDALIFPGGYGAAKNLCDFAVKGENCAVNPEVARLIREMHKAGKPVGFMCIAPVVCAAVFKGDPDVKPTLTIGTDPGTAEKLEKMGAKHVSCRATEICVDEKNLFVSTPAYMLADCITQADKGINRLVDEVFKIASKSSKM